MELDIGYYYNMFLEEIESRKDEDYAINPEQMAKFKKAFDFCIEMANEFNGDITEVVCRPKEEHGGITCEFPLLYFHGESLLKMIETLCTVSAISIDAKTDGTICVSFNVPYVFVKK